MIKKIKTYIKNIIKYQHCKFYKDKICTCVPIQKGTYKPPINIFKYQCEYYIYGYIFWIEPNLYYNNIKYLIERYCPLKLQDNNKIQIIKKINKI